MKQLDDGIGNTFVLSARERTSDGLWRRVAANFQVGFWEASLQNSRCRTETKISSTLQRNSVPTFCPGAQKEKEVPSPNSPNRFLNRGDGPYKHTSFWRAPGSRAPQPFLAFAGRRQYSARDAQQNRSGPTSSYSTA
jgi:hypothetical protein